MNKTLSFLLCGIAVVAVSFYGCRRVSPIFLSEPVEGAFTAADLIPVRGRLLGTLLPGAEVWLNDSALPVDAAGFFEGEIATDPGALLQSLRFRTRNGADRTWRRERAVVVRGTGSSVDDLLESAFALRVNEGALQALANRFSDEIAGDLDVDALLADANPVYDKSFCIIPDPFGGCIQDLDVEVDIEDVEFESAKVELNSRSDFLRVKAILKQFRVDYDVDGIDCRGRITANKITIPGNYKLRPDSQRPARIDAKLIGGSLAIEITGFDNEFTSGACDAPVTGDIVDSLVGNVEELLEDALLDAFADPDGTGPRDSLVANALERALDPRDAWNAVAAGFQTEIETELEEVVVEPSGLELVAAARLNGPPAGCTLEDGEEVEKRGFWVPEPRPDLRNRTPDGSGYDIALSLSASLVNQWQVWEEACGGLDVEIAELGSTPAPIPLTAGAVAAFIPALSALPAEQPLLLTLSSKRPAFLSEQPGPSGEPADIWIADWRWRLIALPIADEAERLLLEASVDLTTGLDLGFSADGGGLSAVLALPPVTPLQVTILENTVGADEEALGAALQALLPAFIPASASELINVPIPDGLGLPLVGVQVARVNGALALYFEIDNN